ncbi:MAG: hypothetical protein J0M30_07580 [Chitinophagales bacterium]|nr:hypothetical protein [Chitinophagales bacterium]
MKNPVPKIKEDVSKYFYYPILKRIELAKELDLPQIDFIQTIKNRRSNRVFSKLDIDKLNQVLFLSSKVLTTDVLESGYIISHRASPSAGARHPIDILVMSPCIGKNELCYYNPFDHSLNTLYIEKRDIEEFISHLNSILPTQDATIIWFIAHPGRTAMKYENPLSLVWRDAGALIYCLQISATALDVNSCSIGSLGEPYISRMFKKYGNVFGVGGLLIG